MSWKPDARDHEPQQHPQRPDVKFVTLNWRDLHVSRDSNMCRVCPFAGNACQETDCEGGYFVTTANLVAIRLTGKI